MDLLVDSPEDVIASLVAFAEQFPDTAAQGAWQELSLIMNASKEQVPADTGILRSSGAVLDPVVSDGLIEIEMGYYTDYAWYVHEGFPKHKDGSLPYHWVGKWKFLEDPLTYMSYGMGGRLMDRFEMLFTQGVG